MTEEWRPVADFPNYEVSSLGAVRSLKTGRPMYQWSNTGGYLSVTLHRDGRRHSRAVHRLVITAFIGPRSDEQVTRHLDGDKSNNTVGNLAIGSQSENVQDMVRHGRHHKAVNESCVNGHPFDEANTYVWGREGAARRCKECSRAAGRRYWGRKVARAS